MNRQQLFELDAQLCELFAMRLETAAELAADCRESGVDFPEVSAPIDGFMPEHLSFINEFISYVHELTVQHVESLKNTYILGMPETDAVAYGAALARLWEAPHMQLDTEEDMAEFAAAARLERSVISLVGKAPLDEARQRLIRHSGTVVLLDRRTNLDICESNELLVLEYYEKIVQYRQLASKIITPEFTSPAELALKMQR